MVRLSGDNGTIDWKQFLEFSQKLKIEIYLLVGIALAYPFFSSRLPDEVKEIINSEKIRSRISFLNTQTLTTNFEYLSWTPRQKLVKKMQYHFSIRKNWSSRFQIIFQHLHIIIKPNPSDFKGRKVTKLQYLFLILKKPFRLWVNHFRTI